jgi:hypothetical protein
LGWLLIGAALVLTGCISHRETVRREPPRLAIEFENDAAARLFCDALSRVPSDRRASESETEISVPIIFSHTRREVSGQNERFNDAVQRRDTNCDGKITEAEARVYSAHR